MTTLREKLTRKRLEQGGFVGTYDKGDVAVTRLKFTVQARMKGLLAAASRNATQGDGSIPTHELIEAAAFFAREELTDKTAHLAPALMALATDIVAAWLGGEGDHPFVSNARPKAKGFERTCVKCHHVWCFEQAKCPSCGYVYRAPQPTWTHEAANVSLTFANTKGETYRETYTKDGQQHTREVHIKGRSWKRDAREEAIARAERDIANGKRNSRERLLPPS